MQAKTGAKDFFLWLGALVALYWSVVAFIFLMFDYINYALPNTLSYYVDPYQSSIPYEMASIIVLFPIGLFLMWLIRRDMVKDPTRSQLWVRRWALIFTLFVAGVTAAGDLIALLTTFLRGEDITLAFILKVLVVFGVAAVVFMHFIADLWGYWIQYPKRALSVGLGVGLLAILSVVAGFFIVGTPQHARLVRLDAQKINDLQSIQSQIVSYYQYKQKLPQSLSDLRDSVSYFGLPTDPQTGASYEYDGTIHVAAGANPMFSLCASFNLPGNSDKYSRDVTYPTIPMGGSMRGFDNWQHDAGRVCFDRTIDPELYPAVLNGVKALPQ
jgi:type III secretory pathway component EscS